MDDDFKHVFKGLLSTNDPVAMNIVENRDPSLTLRVIKYVLPNGTGVTRKKRTCYVARLVWMLQYRYVYIVP